MKFDSRSDIEVATVNKSGIFWKVFIIVRVIGSDATAEAEALTRDLFGWKRKKKQLNQTASASRYYIDYTVL